MRSEGTRYLISEGVRNVRSNRLMSLASVSVLTACLLLAGITILLVGNVDRMLGYIEQQNDVMIFLKDEATSEQVETMRQGLSQLDHVVEVQYYVSKEEALQEYTQNLQGEAFMNVIGNENFLPASLRVSAENLDTVNQIVDEAKKYPIYDTYNAPTGAVDTIVRLKHSVALFGAALILALIIVSLVVISNTIRVTVFTRRREIAIMKQVGATNRFVQIPFLAEGMILGLLSAVLSFLMIWGGYELVQHLLLKNTSRFLLSMYQSILPFSQVGWILALSFLVAGVGAGALGSALSLRKHLNV